MSVLSSNPSLICLLTAKCGSSSIYQSLLKSGIVFDLPINMPDYPMIHPTLSEIMTAYNLTISDLDSYQIIQTVRHPCRRMVSAWKHQLKLCSDLRRTDTFSSFVQRVCSNQYLLFDQWVQFYEAVYPEGYQTQCHAQGHWGGLRFYLSQKQYGLLPDGTLYSPIQYIKLEEVDQTWDTLCQKLGLPNTSFQVINESDDQTNWQSFYTEDLYALVKTTFADDFSMFGYE